MYIGTTFLNSPPKTNTIIGAAGASKNNKNPSNQLQRIKYGKNTQNASKGHGISQRHITPIP